MSFNVIQDLYIVLFLITFDYTVQRLADNGLVKHLCKEMQCCVKLMRVIGHLAGITAMGVSMFYIIH